MREAIARLTMPVFGWIPDVSGVPARRQAVIGGIISILFHLLLLLLLFLATIIFPQTQTLAPAPAKPQLEVELVEKQEEPKLLQLQPPPHRDFLDPNGLQASLEKPKDARFESDRNMVEASEKPPEGLIPLPGQEGRDDLPSLDFKDQEVKLSLSKEPSQPDNASALLDNPSPSPAQATQQPPAATPLYAPNPVAKTDLSKAEKAAPTEALPDPAKPTRATPPPLPKVDTLTDDQMAIAKPSPATTPAPLTKLEPPPKPAESSRDSPTTETPNSLVHNQPVSPYKITGTPAPFPASSPSRDFQKNLNKTRIESSITNRGRSRASSIETPAGRWHAQMDNAISANWHLIIGQREDIVQMGRVVVYFVVDREGRTRDIHIDDEHSSSNDALRQACTQAVRATKLNPPPKEIMDSGDGFLYPVTFGFTYF